MPSHRARLSSLIFDCMRGRERIAESVCSRRNYIRATIIIGIIIGRQQQPEKEEDVNDDNTDDDNDDGVHHKVLLHVIILGPVATTSTVSASSAPRRVERFYNVDCVTARVAVGPQDVSRQQPAQASAVTIGAHVRSIRPSNRCGVATAWRRHPQNARTRVCVAPARLDWDSIAWRVCVCDD